MIEMHESGWWEGCCNDTIGLFPGSYVEIVERFLSSKDAENQEETNAEEASEPQQQTEESTAPAVVEEKKEAAHDNSSSKKHAAEGDEALAEARRFALYFKKMYEAKASEVEALKSNANNANVNSVAVVDVKSSEDYQALQRELETVKQESKAANDRAQSSETRAKDLEEKLANAGSASSSDAGNNDEGKERERERKMSMCLNFFFFFLFSCQSCRSKGCNT